MVSYLLGDLSEKERRSLEDHLFADDEFFEGILSVEDDLIDRFVRDELSAQERAGFERHFLTTPQRLERLRFAETLARYTAVAPAAQTVRSNAPREAAGHSGRLTLWEKLRDLFRVDPRRAGLVFAAAALAFVLGGVWLFVEQIPRPAEKAHTNPQEKIERHEAQTEANSSSGARPPTTQVPDGDALPASGDRAANDSKPRGTPAHLPSNSRAPAPGSTRQPPRRPPQRSGSRGGGDSATPVDRTSSGLVALALSPDLVRGVDEANTLRIPLYTKTAELQLSFEDQYYPRYGAVLETAEGAEVLHVRGLTAQPTSSGRRAIVRIPARLLVAGDYVITLYGETSSGTRETISQYPFRTEKL